MDKGVLAPADQRLLAGDTLVSTPPQIFSLAYRLTGNVLAGPVPEPATWALMIAGFGLAGTALRRRARAGAAYA